MELRAPERTLLILHCLGQFLVFLEFDKPHHFCGFVPHSTIAWRHYTTYVPCGSGGECIRELSGIALPRQTALLFPQMLLGNLIMRGRRIHWEVIFLSSLGGFLALALALAVPWGKAMMSTPFDLY